MLLTHDLEDIQIIGIPRGLLYYRYGALWTAFFEALGRKVVISNITDKKIVEAGSQVSVDECCLASKTYMGHIKDLIGRCDGVFVPCYASHDPRAGFCTKFQSLPDLVKNTFNEQNLLVISLLVEDITNSKKTRHSFYELALRLGASSAEAKRAWKAGEKAQEVFDEKRASAQEKTLKQLKEQRKIAEKKGSVDYALEHPFTVLLVSHPYLAHDDYLCGAVIDALKALDATIIFADETNHEQSYKASNDFSRTLPWVINRELIGSILTLQDLIDGIVLISAFPCGPDSMTNDAIMRCIQGTPILNLMIDALSGTAGIETRIESFVDILHFKRQGGYINAR